MQTPVTDEMRRRRTTTIFLGILALLLLAALSLFTSFKQISLEPSTAGDVLVFTAISSLAVLLFVAILLLFIRNLLRLYADQQNRVLGARLRWRMLVGALLISFAPILFMYFYSYGLLNRSVDRWFSQPVTELRDDSNNLAMSLASYSTANARAEAEEMAMGLESSGLLSRENSANVVPAELRQWIARHAVALQGGFAILYQQEKPMVDFNLPASAGQSVVVKPWLDSRPDAQETKHAGGPLQTGILHAAQRPDEPIFSIGTTDYALGLAQSGGDTIIVTGLPMPSGMSSAVHRLRSGTNSYWELFRERRTVRANFMALLFMITTLAFFASSWLALHMAKQVTRPVEALADAMDEIAAGHYAHRVAASATTELGELVNSFNHMAEDLENSRIQAEASTRQLSSLNTALETRRVELETLLETIPNGVVTLDLERRVMQANRAFSEMIDPSSQQPFIGQMLEELFSEEAVEILERLFRRSHRMGVANGEMELHLRDKVLSFVATVALLEVGNDNNTQRSHGYVLVLEDVTELLRAQKQVAWKEVARRVAHEIKNPLTPIALSAERIQRHLLRLPASTQQSASVGIMQKCSEVIRSSVESMRTLVDQFSTLAEFPTARPKASDLNDIVRNSLALFAGRLSGVRIEVDLAKDLPLVMADSEALKRALANLIDNAAEAVQDTLLREIYISTCLVENEAVITMAELEVTDTGHGLTDDMRERLFMPYVSTKERGTGLGLAIVAKIIQDHGGTIRAEKNSPAGARFLIELPLANPLVNTELQLETVAMRALNSGERA